MKKFLFAVLFVLCAVNVVAFAEVKGAILRYEPTPAEQGNSVDVWVQLSNVGEAVEDVELSFVPEYPFSLPAGQPGSVAVGRIAASEEKVVKFTVFVDPGAPNGDEDITFMYRSKSSDWTVMEEPITIQTQNAALVVDEYTVDPSPIIPGRVAVVKLKLRNAGRISVKNIDVELGLEDEFSTIGSSTKQRIPYIGVGESEMISFTIASDSSTQVKLYGVPVKLNFQDERNKNYEDEARISLLFNADPELSVTVDSTEFESRKSPGTVSLKIVNKGISDLKYLTVFLRDSDDYKLLSTSNEEYIGNLDNDDFETVDFVVKPLVQDPHLNLVLEFKDSYNVDFRREFDLPLRIITAKDLGRRRSPVMLILFAVLVVGGIFWWRRKKRKKR